MTLFLFLCGFILFERAIEYPCKHLKVLLIMKMIKVIMMSDNNSNNDMNYNKNHKDVFIEYDVLL